MVLRMRASARLRACVSERESCCRGLLSAMLARALHAFSCTRGRGAGMVEGVGVDAALAYMCRVLWRELCGNSEDVRPG